MQRSRAHGKSLRAGVGSALSRMQATTWLPRRGRPGPADPALFLEYVRWVKTLFDGLHFSLQSLVCALDCTGQAIREMLPADSAHLSALCPRAGPHGGKGRNGAGRLLYSREEGLFQEPSASVPERSGAGEYEGGEQPDPGGGESATPVRDIYLTVFQPCQRELGRMWQINRLSVAQEHAATAVTQLIIAQLSAQVFGKTRQWTFARGGVRGRGAAWQLGIRMVTDIFEIRDGNLLRWSQHTDP